MRSSSEHILRIVHIQATLGMSAYDVNKGFNLHDFVVTPERTNTKDIYTEKPILHLPVRKRNK